MTSRPSAAQWRRPDQLRELPPRCPIDQLPDLVQAVTRAVATQFQVPTDFALLAALAVLAGATRGQIDVQVRDGWTEALSLYVAPLMPSGSRKSHALSWLVRPLQEAERDAAQLVAPIRETALSRQRIAQKRLDAAERSASMTASPDAQAEVDAALGELRSIAVPPRPRYLLDDATPEAIAATLAEQGSTAVISAEGGIVSILSGSRYGNGTANLDAVLKAYDGEPITVDRRGSESLYAERPHLVLCIAAQPDVLRELRGSVEMRERGLLSRFIYVLPEPLLGERDLDPPAAPPGTVEAWAMVIRGLLTGLSPGTISLTADALAALQPLRQHVEQRLLTESDDDAFSGWASKLPGRIARIAALFTLAGDPTSKHVDAWAVQAAVALAPWLTWHAREASHLRTPLPTDDVLRLLCRWQRSAVRDATDRRTFSTREVQQAIKQHSWAKHGGVDAVRDALLALLAAGWIAPIDRPLGAPGRESELWQWHPELLAHYESQRN